MRFSVHNVHQGGFDYYEAPGAVAINDDHPTPSLASLRTKIGVPASRAGRPMPSGAKKVGHGKEPVGSISNGKSGAWSNFGNGILPSGMGSFDDVPCPTRIEGAVLGTLAGAVLNMISVPEQKQTILKGATYASLGGVLGFWASKLACRYI